MIVSLTKTRQSNCWSTCRRYRHRAPDAWYPDQATPLPAPFEQHRPVTEGALLAAEETPTGSSRIRIGLCRWWCDQDAGHQGDQNSETRLTLHSPRSDRFQRRRRRVHLRFQVGNGVGAHVGRRGRDNRRSFVPRGPLLIDEVFEYFPEGCSRAQVEASLSSQVHHADDARW